MILPGFVSPYKGHGDAINALEHLPENFKLVIAGGRHPKDRGASRYWMELLAIVESNSLQNRVLFTGFLATGGAQAAILKQADLFILPYKEVGQSGSAVLADALAYDRPVVTSRARSMFAYRMSQDCVYSSMSTDVTDAKDFAAHILNALENKAEDSYVASHRKAAISRYSLNSIGFAYEQLYKEVRGKTECVSA
jgi:glycosyltransferase involved in cell wall biosynthesis